MTVKYFSVKETDKGLNLQLPTSRVLWSAGRNVRFFPGSVKKILGKTYIATTSGALPVRDAFTFVGTDGAIRTIVCCDAAVYAYDSNMANPSTITPAVTPTGGVSDIWEFALVSGLPILTNGKNAIWKWPAYNSILAPLSGAPTYAKRISSLLHRLVVSDISEGGYTYTGRVRWTEPGNPENWTIDTTGKAGRFDIIDYNTGIEALAKIKAQIAHGARMFFFTERGLWISDFAQATKQFIEVDPEAEILSSMALCRLGGHIYYLGKTDVFRTQAGTPDPIGLPIRKDLFDSINQNALAAAFVFPIWGTSEVWFCIPTGTSTVADTAYIYNEELKTWTIADVDFSCHAESGLLKLPTDVIGTADGDILTLDSGDNRYSGSTYFGIDGRIETGDLNFDLPDVMKKVSDVIPDLEEQTTVSELMVQVGVRNRLADDIKWSDPVPFTIGVSERCDFNGFRKEGKWVRIRFYSNLKDSPWTLTGFTVKYETGGTR